MKANICSTLYLCEIDKKKKQRPQLVVIEWNKDSEMKIFQIWKTRLMFEMCENIIKYSALKVT